MSEESSIKEYRCKFCSLEFTRSCNMYRHMKRTCKVRKFMAIEKPKKLGKVVKKDLTQNDKPTASEPEPEKSGVPVNSLVEIIKTQQDQLVQQQDQLIQQQNQIDTLADIIKNKPSDTVNNNNTNNIINNNNIIYVTDQLDYLEILDKKFGGEKKKTIEFIKNKLHGKLDGEIDVFSAIHLSGPPNTWPIKCPDKSKRQFYLVQPDNTMIPDPGGVTTHKNFYRNLQTAVLKLINLELTKVIDRGVGSEEFETLRDNLLDDFDLQTFQNRALEMSHQKPGPFVKRLAEEMGQLELSNQLNQS